MSIRRIGKAFVSMVTGVVTSRHRPCSIAAFHQGRSGSRLLGDLIKQHSRMVWDGELFSPGRLGDIASRWPILTRDPLSVLRLRMVMGGARCYGFETQPTQVEHLELGLAEYVQRLEGLGFGHFLMLERKNHLRRFVSMLVARQTSEWHRQHGRKPEVVRLRLETENLLLSRGRDTEARPLVAQLDRERATWRELREILAARKMLYLTYEDDLAVRPEQAYEKVCEFVGFQPEPVTVRFFRTNPYRLPDILTNYDEVAAALAGTEYEWMLDD